MDNNARSAPEAGLPLTEEPHAREARHGGGGRTEAALRLWRAVSDAKLALEAMAAQAPSAVVLCRLGETQLALGDPAGAEASFRAACAIDDSLPCVHVGLGRAAEAQGHRDQACQHLRHASGLGCDADAIEGLLHRLQATLPSAPNGRGLSSAEFADRFKFANELMQSRRFHDAEALYRSLLVSRPGSPALLYKLGTALVELGQLEEAATLYDKAIAADAGFVWSYVGRADLLEATGRLTEAREALETARKVKPDLAFLSRRLTDLRRRLETHSVAGGPSLVTWPATAPAPRAARRRVAVVAWDLSHNAVGRAWILAEMAVASSACELVGPVFPAYGNDLWEPLRDSSRSIDVHGFHAGSFADFMNGALQLVIERPCDVALVSKPRFSSLLIGLLYKAIHGARLILDIDDDELAFVDAHEALDATAFIDTAEPSDWRAPHGKRWTQLAASLIDASDARTVCSPVLRKKFGGTVIRHARNEQLFESGTAERYALRKEFGFADTDKVVLFLGTPRRHKGLLQIATAVRDLGDPDVVLCIVGTIADERLKEELLAVAPARIALHPDQPFTRLGALNAMADAVCILQDATSRIALSQTPAKLTDALATGTPVIATALPPIEDLIVPGRIVPLDKGADEAALVALLRDVLAGTERAPEAAAQRRAFFREELSSAVNAERLAAVIDEVLSRGSTPLPMDLHALLRHIEREMPGRLGPEWERSGSQVLGGKAGVGPLQRLDRDLNIVLFWKQNDSGIYGRRPDMLVRELSRLPGVRRILQIDAPVCVDQLTELAAQSKSGNRSQGRQIAAQVVRRFLEADDSGCVHRRTFVYRGDASHLLGRELPLEAAFPNAVERWMTELGMTDNVLAWVCPVIPWFPEIQARLGFSFVLSDVIDDQRQWPMPALRRARISKSYRDTFDVTDAATANCAAVTEWLEAEGLPARLVPNGMEIYDDVSSWPVPPDIQKLGRPIIGYSGSLTHRFDWQLLASIADQRPDWTIVLIGAVPDGPAADAVLARPNVHALGVVPYDQAVRYIASFDVAIVPHLRTVLSERMNPLKIYVYRSLGIDVVSTPVPNIEDFVDDIRIALPQDFVDAIDAALVERAARGRSIPSDRLRRTCSWSVRLQEILAHAETALIAKLARDSAGQPASLGVARRAASMP